MGAWRNAKAGNDEFRHSSEHMIPNDFRAKCATCGRSKADESRTWLPMDSPFTCAWQSGPCYEKFEHECYWHWRFTMKISHQIATWSCKITYVGGWIHHISPCVIIVLGEITINSPCFAIFVGWNHLKHHVGWSNSLLSLLEVTILHRFIPNPSPPARHDHRKENRGETVAEN